LGVECEEEKKGRKKENRDRIVFDLGPTQKKQLELIKSGTGLELTILCRYAVTLLIKEFTAGEFDLKAALKHKAFAAERRKAKRKGRHPRSRMNTAPFL